MKINLRLPIFALMVFLILSSCNKENFTENLLLQNPEISDDLSLDGKAKGFHVDIERGGSVYVMDNAVGSNHVLVFERGIDGKLSAPRKYATEGCGTGTGLGSQGSIVKDGAYLYVCNAGTNDITVFEIIDRQTLKFIDKSPSVGKMPTSITVHGNIIYVLNAGGKGNISGFRSYSGKLSYIHGSKQALSSSNAAAAQISFNNTGDQLVVTERATNRITTYPVTDGIAEEGTSHQSAGNTPFGFEFNPDDELIVSEAFGGAPNASAVSYYNLETDGEVDLINGPVATHQTAACWITMTHDGKYVYASNTGSASITGYRVHKGKLRLLNPDGVTGKTGAGPIDMDMSPNSIFLYVVNAADNSISILSRRYNGQLFHVDTVTDLPDAMVGIVVD